MSKRTKNTANSSAPSTSSTHLYVFGSGDCGQLGLGEDLDTIRRPKLHPFFKDKEISLIAAGGLHTLALSSSSGKVWSWGCNDEKALGHNQPEYEVGEVLGLGGRIIQIAAGDSISAALDTNGQIWTWGTFRDSKGVLGHDHEELIQEQPTLLTALLGTKIDQIAAGANHLMAVSADGQLFAWGSGEQGQLGKRVLERHKKLALRPRNVTPKYGRSRVRVRRIVCGSYHSLVFGEAVEGGEGAGGVFAVGLNNFGQLGLGDHDDRMVAEPIPSENWNGAIPVDGSAGEHHSLVMCNDGAVYAFGRTDSGQLGIQVPPGARACNRPVRIEALPPCHLISSGGNHNLALATHGLYSWGYGEMHQLGHGPDQIEPIPRLVEHGDSIKGRVCQISAGGQHSVILTQ